MRLPRRDLHSLAGPYALDALDAGERDRFERHLERCPRCQEEVRRMSQTATALAMAAAAEPPAGVKERVLAAVAVTPQLPPVTGAEATAASGAASTAVICWLRAWALSSWCCVTASRPPSTAAAATATAAIAVTSRG